MVKIYTLFQTKTALPAKQSYFLCWSAERRGLRVKGLERALRVARVRSAPRVLALIFSRELVLGDCTAV